MRQEQPVVLYTFALVSFACADPAAMADAGTTAGSEASVDTSDASIESSGATTAPTETSSVADETSDTSASADDSSSSESTGQVALVVANDDAFYPRQNEILHVAARDGVLANDVASAAATVVGFNAITDRGAAADIGLSGSVDYTPIPDDWGRDTLRYTVAEGVNESTAEITLHIAPTHVSTPQIDPGRNGAVLRPEEPYDIGGAAVRGAGDVDGDGMPDIIVSAPAYQRPGPIDGRVFVIFGTTDLASVELSDIAAGEGGFVIDHAENTAFAVDADAAGDVDGDGRDDLIIGDYFTPGNAGRAYVAFGKADGDPVFTSDLLAGDGGFAIEGEPDSAAGYDVAGVGDIDDDGFADVVVDAINSAPSPDAGAVYLVYGKPTTEAVALADVRVGLGGHLFEGSGGQGPVGFAVGPAGDFNGDGAPDFAFTAAERCYVVLEDPGPADRDLDDLAAGNGGLVIELGTRGVRMAHAGDFNGDGRSDLLFGSNTAGQERSVLVFGTDDAAPITVVPDDPSVAISFVGASLLEGVGDAVGGGGDVDGDGFDDLIIAAPFSTFPTEAGRAYVVYGGVLDEALVSLVAVADDGLGFDLVGGLGAGGFASSVAVLGDIDGDGLAESALVSYNDDSGIHIVYGVATAPRRRR